MVKEYKPITPGQRELLTPDFAEITGKEPFKGLTKSLGKRTDGRNVYGRITVRHRGGGHKRLYRFIDFKRDKINVPARVESVEYDPNRTARIALLKYADGERRYILAPEGLKVGNMVAAGSEVDIKPGNALPLNNIPLGTIVHNVELKPGKGGQIGRSAGASIQLMAKENNYATLRLASSEIRLVPLNCFATVGQVGNLDHENISLGKAGRSRWLGRRPRVRGMTMNPCDHPMGGGEGRSKGGKHPVSPWGQKAKGLKTRSNPRTDRYIIQRRQKKSWGV